MRGWLKDKQISQPEGFHGSKEENSKRLITALKLLSLAAAYL
jgi:hypothetical protein